MGSPLKSLTVRGFKSVRQLEAFELRSVNVLIGANGAGKSNFADFFRLLRAVADEGLQKFVNEQGGGDGFFFQGPKATPRIDAHLEFGDNAYELTLEPTRDGSLQIAEERAQYTGGQGFGKMQVISRGRLESALGSLRNESATWSQAAKGVPGYVYDSVSQWTVYHYHDTSMLSPVRREQSLHDWERLRHDGSNLATYLYHLEGAQPAAYELVRDMVRRIAPFFDDFAFRPRTRGNEEKIALEWRQKGSDFPFQPHQLSDGTLRFICLAATLLQPVIPPTVVIDEPELGLHPAALALLASLVQSAAQRTQVVLSTQSALLLDHFDAQDVVVVSRRDGASAFERLDAQALAEWLTDYSLGELWRKNVVQAGVVRE